MINISDINNANTFVDTNIRNKVAFKSITPENEADCMATILALIQGLLPDQIVSGMALTAANGSISVAAGSLQVQGVVYPIAPQTLTTDVRDNTQSRIDVLYADSSGILHVEHGDLADDPVEPVVPNGAFKISIITISPSAEVINTPDPGSIVDTSSNQVIDGQKTFNTSPIVSDATQGNQATNLTQVEELIAAAAGNYIDNQNSSAQTGNLWISGVAKAGAFVVPGGTANGFLKADGSIDNSTYATASELIGYVPYTGATGSVDLNGFQITAGLFISPDGGGNYGAYGATGLITAGPFKIDYSNGISTITGNALGFDIQDDLGGFHNAVIMQSDGAGGVEFNVFGKITAGFATINPNNGIDDIILTKNILAGGFRTDSSSSTALTAGRLTLFGLTGENGITIDGDNSSITTIDDMLATYTDFSSGQPGHFSIMVQSRPYPNYQWGKIGVSDFITALTAEANFNSTVANSFIPYNGATQDGNMGIYSFSAAALTSNPNTDYTVSINRADAYFLMPSDQASGQAGGGIAFAPGDRGLLDLMGIFAYTTTSGSEDLAFYSRNKFTFFSDTQQVLKFGDNSQIFIGMDPSPTSATLQVFGGREVASFKNTNGGGGTIDAHIAIYNDIGKSLQIGITDSGYLGLEGVNASYVGGGDDLILGTSTDIVHINGNGLTGFMDYSSFVTAKSFIQKTYSDNTYQTLANLSTNTSLGSSDTLYPSQKAVKSYVDAHVGGGVTFFNGRSGNVVSDISDYSSFYQPLENQRLSSSNSPSFVNVTSALTGHASLDLPLTAGSGSPLSSFLSFGTFSRTSAGDANTIKIYEATGNNYGIGINVNTGELSYTAGSVGYQSFYTANTERARFTSDGKFLLGYTADPTSGNIFAANGNGYFNGSITQSSVISSLLKANSSGQLVAASAGVDYASATSGITAFSTSGTSGAATFSAGALNIPNYSYVNPMTTLGDLIYGGTSGAQSRLPGNTTTTKKFLLQTGDGTNSAAPTWFDLFGGTNTWAGSQTFTGSTKLQGVSLSMQNGSVFFNQGSTNGVNLQLGTSPTGVWTASLQDKSGTLAYLGDLRTTIQVTGNTTMSAMKSTDFFTYLVTSSTSSTLLLPSSCVAGAIILVVGGYTGTGGSPGWQITQNAGDKILTSGGNTTTGTGGSVTSALYNNTIMIICLVPNTGSGGVYQVISQNGTPSFV